MKYGLVSGALMVLIATMVLTASVAQQSPPPANGASGPAPQDQAKPSTPATASKRKIPCKTPENASMCYWTHGRLSIYEGTVPYRIWKIGTHRLLGVFSGPSHYPAETDDDVFKPELPAELYNAYGADNQRLKRETGTMWAIPPPAFADFEVCPLRPEIRGERQPVCIESAKNIFIEKKLLATGRLLTSSFLSHLYFVLVREIRIYPSDARTLAAPWITSAGKEKTTICCGGCEPQRQITFPGSVRR